MNFKPELAAKVLAGVKTQTRRAVSINERSPWYVFGCRVTPGKDYAVCPGRGKHAIGRVMVTAVRKERLALISDADAIAEGFSGRDEFFDAWTAINGKPPHGLFVWAITFHPTEQES